MAYGDFWDDIDSGVDEAIRRRPHAQAIENLGALVQSWFPQSDIYLESQHRAHGRPGPRRRWPDIQFVNPVRHRATHIEVDTTAAGMRNHISRRDRNRRNVFLQIHPATGAIMRKVVYAPGATRPLIDQRRTRTTPIQLQRTDVFDAFDD
jgi:hypothetical protein